METNLLTEAIKLEIRQAYGNLGVMIPGYRKRRGQMEMIAQVSRTLSQCRSKDDGSAFDGSNMAVIEAKTGTGKTAAYLLPSLIMGRHLARKVIVSTGSIALQEQLLTKDLPLVTQAIGGHPFRFAIAKGRARYVCHQRLERLISEASQTSFLPDAAWDRPPETREITLLGLLAGDLSKSSWNGDRDALGEDMTGDLWGRIANDANLCTGHKCADFARCPFYAARKQVDGADVVVANHDLVLSNAANHGKSLPDLDASFVLFDEAHHLPDAALSQFTVGHSLLGSSRLMDRLPGVLSRAGAAVREFDAAAVGDTCHTLSHELKQLAHSLDRSDVIQAGKTQRFAHGALPDALKVAGGNLLHVASSLADSLHDLKDRLDEAMDRKEIPGDVHARLASDLGFYRSRVGNIVTVWESMLDTEHVNAKWVGTAQDGKSVDFTINTAVLEPGGLLRRMLWERASATVFTSATLRTLGTFSYFTGRSGLNGLPNLAAIEVASAFDYMNQGAIVTPKMRTDPSNAESHTAEVAELLPQIVDLDTGTLVLFASRRQMEAVASAMPDEFKARLLVQGQLPKQDMLRLHSEAIHSGRGSVLFGLKSLGEGVDLPGRLCEHVIVSKLPFAPPDNPVDEALAELIEKTGGNSFLEISVSKVGLMLCQWSGRLIRTEDDTGTITILDRRIRTKRYGKLIIDGLPPFRQLAEPLPKAA